MKSRTAQILAAVLLAGMLGLLFYPFRFEVNARFWRALMDAAHLPFFFAFALILQWLADDCAKQRHRRLSPANSKMPLRFFSRRRPTAGHDWYIPMSLAGLIVGSELVQPWFGRSGSFMDALFGVCGAGAAIFFIHGMRHGPRPVIAGLVVGGLWFPANFAVSSVRSAWKTMAYRDQQFPVLGSYKSRADLQLWLPNGLDSGERLAVRVEFEPRDGRRVLSVHPGSPIPKSDWPGVWFDAGEQDWSRYAELVCEVYNPHPPFILRVRVDDDGDCSKHGMRFDRELPMTNGWNSVRIATADIAAGPRDRRLNLKAIRRLVFFVAREEAPPRFELAGVRLKGPHSVKP